MTPAARPPTRGEASADVSAEAVCRRIGMLSPTVRRRGRRIRFEAPVDLDAPADRANDAAGGRR